MTGAEHFAEAQRLMQPGAKMTDEVGAYTFDSDADRFAAAQVHATLALAAATVDGPAVARYLGAIPGGDGDDIRPVDRAWSDVTA